MILFCDTSALVKLYVVEEGSDIMHQAARRADALAVSRIAWAEFHAALARRARMVPADESALEQARAALVSQWQNFLVVEVSQRVVELAGEHADLYALRPTTPSSSPPPITWPGMAGSQGNSLASTVA